MPLDQVIIDLPHFKIIKVIDSGILSFEVVYEGPNVCPYCQGKELRTKDSFLRKARHICIGARTTELLIRSRKFKCLGCAKYFNQRFKGLNPRKRATEPFRRDVFQKHHDGIA